MARISGSVGRGPVLWVAWFALSFLLMGACGDDGGTDDAAEGDAGTTSSAEVSPDDPPAGDDSTSTTAGDEGGIGTMEVDGETHVLDSVIGVTSCDFDDPDGQFTVAARSEDGEAFLRLDSFADSPDSNEFTLAVGEVEYVSASAEDVVYATEDQTVSGTIPVVPLFEEGTAQDVSFEVVCP